MLTMSIDRSAYEISYYVRLQMINADLVTKRLFSTHVVYMLGNCDSTTNLVRSRNVSQTDCLCQHSVSLGLCIFVS